MDVIFNGSGGRKPAGMAEVALVFENPKRDDGTRMLNLDVDEVAVGRRLFRDGTSEYQLNNQTVPPEGHPRTVPRHRRGRRCVQRDRAGPRRGAARSQPRRTPADLRRGRRHLASSRQRRKKSQRKLEKVDQNLLRVNDIVEEVEKRLRSVKIQAGRARTYPGTLDAPERTAADATSLQEYHTHHHAARPSWKRSARTRSSAWTTSPAIWPQRRTSWPRSASSSTRSRSKAAAAGIRAGAGQARDAVGPAAAAVRRAAACSRSPSRSQAFERDRADCRSEAGGGRRESLADRNRDARSS